MQITEDNHWDFVYTRNNHIEYNDISNVMQKTYDGGAIESWGVGKGTVINNNAIHDMSNPDWNNWFGAVYLDDGSDYVTVTNNVVYGVRGDKLTFGIIDKNIQNDIENNVIADNQLAFGMYLSPYLEVSYGLALQDNNVANNQTSTMFTVGSVPAGFRGRPTYTTSLSSSGAIAADSGTLDGHAQSTLTNSGVRGGDGGEIVNVPDSSGAPTQGGVTLALLNAAGATSLLLRYSNGGSTGTVGVYVNGTKLPSVALPTTGDWGTTDTVSIPLSTPLGTGNNTVRIAREAEEAWVNYYDVTPSFLIDANSGTLTGNARAHQIGGDRQPAVNIPDNADGTSGTGSVTLTLPNPAGTRSILLRYSNGNTAQPDTATISINGQTPFTAHLPTTGDWTKTAIVTIPLDTPLTNSSNTITISRVTNNPTTGRPDGWINYYDVTAQSAPNRIALSDNNLLYESSGTYNVWKNGQTESFGLAERHVRRQDPLRPAQRHRSGTRVR